MYWSLELGPEYGGQMAIHEPSLVLTPIENMCHQQVLTAELQSCRWLPPLCGVTHTGMGCRYHPIPDSKVPRDAAYLPQRVTPTQLCPNTIGAPSTSRPAPWNLSAGFHYLISVP